MEFPAVLGISDVWGPPYFTQNSPRKVYAAPHGVCWVGAKTFTIVDGKDTLVIRKHVLP